MPTKGRPRTHDARIVSVSFPSELLEKMDEIESIAENRSQWIVEAVNKRLAPGVCRCSGRGGQNAGGNCAG